MDYLLGVLIHSVSKILAALIDVTGSPGLSVLLLGGLLQALLYVPLRGRHRLNRAMS